MSLGRFNPRWRSALGWTLFLLLLAGMVPLLAAILPPQPRWSVRSPLFFHGITPDSRAVITTRRMPVNDSRPPLTVLDLATGQALTSLFADGHDINFSITIPEDGKDAMIYVQLHPADPWELHLMNTTTFATRRLPFAVPSATTHFVTTVPNAPVAVFSPRPTKQNLPGDVSLLDYELGIGQTFPNQNYITQFIANGPMLFFGTLDGLEAKLTFWDRREKDVKTISLGQAGIYVSGDECRAVTTQTIKPGQMRVKLWDLANGAVLMETLTEEGSIWLSRDGEWAMIQPEMAFVIPAVPDPHDRGHQATFWNLREARRVGVCPWEPGDRFDVIADQTSPQLLVTSLAKSEIQLRDLNTLQTIWSRNWPKMNNLAQAYRNPHFMREYVAYGNDLERLDLSTGKTRERIILASPRYDAQAALRGGGVAEMFDPTVSADGRFVVFRTHFVANQTTLGERVLAMLRSIVGMRERSNELDQLSVIELATGKLLMQTPNYADSPINNWQLSADGQSLLILSFTGDDDGNETILECWDLPAQKRWGWIFGVPLAFWMGLWLTGWAWTRWRKGQPRPIADVAQRPVRFS